MATNNTTDKPNNSKWFQEWWLPLLSFMYIAICVCDFIVFPVLTSMHNAKIEDKIVAEIQTNQTAQAAFIDAYEKATTLKEWQPLTLMGGGLFHLAMGSILTGGAVTRGLQKKSDIEGYYNSLGNQNNQGQS